MYAAEKLRKLQSNGAISNAALGERVAGTTSTLVVGRERSMAAASPSR